MKRRSCSAASAGRWRTAVRISRARAVNAAIADGEVADGIAMAAEVIVDYLGEVARPAAQLRGA